MFIDKISKSINRVDAAEKINGSIQYLADMDFKDFLYAKTLRSTKPRAKIVSIDLPKLPEGYYIIDKNDVPSKNKVKMIIYDQPFFAEDTVNYIGEPILLLTGPDKETVEELISKIKVNYEELKGVFSIAEAESCQAPAWDSGAAS